MNIPAIKEELKHYSKMVIRTDELLATVAVAHQYAMSSSYERDVELSQLFTDYPDRDLLPETMQLCDNPDTVFLGLSLLVAALLSGK